MADKVQNIVINYKVNTAEVEKAKNLSQQAQQATDKFHQSAQQGASKSASELHKLTSEQTRLENAIKTTNRSAFTSYAAYTKQLQGLSRQYSDVKIKVEQATKAVNEQNKAQEQLNKNTASMSKTFGALGSTILAVFSVAALRQVVNFTLETARLAGNIEGVSRAFNTIPNATLILEDLRRATLGTVTDLELMQKALSAKNFGISLQALPDLLEFAAVRAQQTGQSVDYLVNSIVNGIGRKSLLILDNLQISATDINKELDGMSIKAASVGQVSEAVGRIASRELDKMGGSLVTAATRVDRLTANYEKLRGVLSTALTKGSGGLLDFINEGLKGSADIISGKGISQGIIDEKAIESVNQFVKALGPDAQKNIEETQQKLNSTIQIIGRYNDMIRETRAEIELGKGFGFPGFSEENQAGAKRYAELVEQYGNRAKEAFEAEIELARARLGGFERAKAVLQATIPLLKEYFSSLSVEGAQASEQLGLIQQKMDEIEAVSESLQAAKSTGEIHRLNVELEKLNGELADLKAFGTTKRQLIVNGELRLVPVIAPKGEGSTVAAKGSDMTAQLQSVVDEMLKGVSANLNLAPSGQVDIIPMDEWDRIGQEFSNNWQDILGTGLADTTDFLGAVIQAEADSYEARIAQSRQYYDRLMILAGDNEKAKDRLRLREQKEENRLRREAFEADKRAKAATAAINGAAGIVNAFATLPYPAALVASVLIAAQTAAQIAVINQQKPRFAKGVLNLQGPGTKTSDSIDAKLSKGESVMTADETRSSMGILKAVRAKTLNDKVLKDLKISATGVVYAGGMTDKGIIAKLDEVKNSIPDIAEKHGMLWKTKKKSENYRQWVRNKSF